MKITNHGNATPSELFGQPKVLNVNRYSLNETPKKSFNDYSLTIKSPARVKGNRVRHVQEIAQRIADTLNENRRKSTKDAQEDYKFFCKCAWKLPESVIWTSLEAAIRPQVECPLKYFTSLALSELACR